MESGEGGALNMHIIRLDIDRKNSAEHLQVGPLGSGLNAVYAPVSGGCDSMIGFIRSILFRGTTASDALSDDYSETTDGSLQWVDASGHVRMMNYASGSPLHPSRYVHSPLHPSERPIHSDDRDQIRGLGNIFWEGDDQDARWDELRGDILGMIFCSSLGSISPEKLWWAASRLGVHSAARTEPDEGYQRLKSEEQELLDKLRNIENVDHDRAWWSLERDRIAAELTHIQRHNLETSIPVATPAESSSVQLLREKLVSLQFEIARLRELHQEAIVNEANSKLDMHRGDEYRTSTPIFKNISLQKSEPATAAKLDYVGERLRLQARIEKLLAEQATCETDIRNATAVSSTASFETIKRWDDTQLRQQYAHAEEMIRRWDRRTQAHRRLAEIQSHLKTRSPFRRTTEGSLIPAAEKFLRELTSGAARQLPPWAVEATYLYTDHPAIEPNANEPAYRSEYYDRTLPASSTRQRKLVDLAIRLAIAQAAIPRVGRIPLLLDDAISSFRGESLEQILHVLATFSRDGRQLIVSTQDEYTARRIAAHGGTVSRMQEILRYGRPSYTLDGQMDLGLHPSLQRSAFFGPAHASQPLRVVGLESANYELGELNRQLAGLANEQAVQSWWYPEHAEGNGQTRYSDRVTTPNTKRFFLYVDSPVGEAPGVDAELAQRFYSAGVYRVGDLLRSPASTLGTLLRIDPRVIEHIQRVSELMCGTPQLRAFDAQVLVGCGITRSSSLRDFAAAELINRVEAFLGTIAGQDLVRRASSFEVSRLHSWLADMKRNLGQRSSSFANNRDRSQRRERPSRESRTIAPRPRLARTSDYDFDRNSQPSASNAPYQESATAASSTAATKSAVATNSHWKFYLDIDSPVVDAPSIGPKMAERIAAFGISSVGDLLASDPANIASQLADRNVSSETVLQWQHQALLVCRIPNLRGHDAQLIVGAGLISAEQVAASEAATLYANVTRFANTKAGLRVLRGTPAPDLAEVSDWIQWAHNCRAIRAA